MTINSAHVGLGIFLALLSWAPVAGAQKPDSLATMDVAPLIVTATRVRTPLITSTSAASRLSREDLRSLPVRTVAEALETLPGIIFVDNDGMGFDPQLTIRGFYGGGEAEYVVVLLNGRPLNAIETGLTDWEIVPIDAIETIEVVRGGGSSLYGDAAVGGVINIITTGNHRGVRGRISGGAPGIMRSA